MLRAIHIPGDIETLKKQFPALNNLKQISVIPTYQGDLQPGSIGKFEHSSCAVAKSADAPTRLVGVDKKTGYR